MININYNAKACIKVIVISYLMLVIRIVTPIVSVIGIVIGSMAVLKIAACMAVIESGGYFALAYNFKNDNNITTEFID